MARLFFSSSSPIWSLSCLISSNRLQLLLPEWMYRGYPDCLGLCTWVMHLQQPKPGFPKSSSVIIRDLYCLCSSPPFDVLGINSRFTFTHLSQNFLLNLVYLYFIIVRFRFSLSVPQNCQNHSPFACGLLK